MSEPTKTCNLTEAEIKHLISHHGYSLDQTNSNERIERINYLNKRLKTFDEPASDLKSEPSASGWASN